MNLTKRGFFILFIIFVLGFQNVAAQDENTAIEKPMSMNVQSEKTFKESDFGLDLYDPLGPAKAAFYSAIIPGLGQIYNRKYWKLPLVYAAIGTTTYFYIDNNNQYNTYRNAFKQRLTGQEDEFLGVLTDQNLIDAQKLFRKNRDLSLLLVIGAYILNIVDANVDAHLQQFNISDKLSLKPNTDRNFMTGGMTYGLSLNFKLN